MSLTAPATYVGGKLNVNAAARNGNDVGLLVFTNPTTHNGYGMVYDPVLGNLQLVRMDGGQPTNLGTPLHVSEPSNYDQTYTVEMLGWGDDLKAVLYGPDNMHRLGDTTATDATYTATGMSGFYIAENADQQGGPSGIEPLDAELDSLCSTIAGDATRDGRVTISDFATMSVNFLKTGANWSMGVLTSTAR